MEVASQLKSFGLLTNNVLRLVASLFSEIDSMNPQELALFTMIVASQEMQTAVTVSNLDLLAIKLTSISD